MRYIFVIITLLGLSSCISTNSSSMYPIEKGKSEHGLTMLGLSNFVSYTFREGITDDLEIDGHIGLISIGANLKYHLYKDNNNILSFNIGLLDLFIFETALSYTILKSKYFGVRFSGKYQYFYNTLSNRYEDSDGKYYDITDFQRAGGTITIGGTRLWIEVGYLFVIDKNIKRYDDDGMVLNLNPFDYNITEKENQIILKIGIAF
ncbi:hypothetical protein JXR93_09975 [bacterium]|nr:hypothetical protein [bacterium]